MIKKKLLLLLPFLFLLVIIKSGCVDIPKDLVMPKWDVDVNVPISNRSYTLWDAIKKDTSQIKSYPSGSSQGLLYYSDIKTIEKITVGDNLKVDAFTTASSVQIGTIRIPDPQPVTAKILPSNLGLPNATIPFPPANNTVVSADFDQSQQFTRVVIQTGNLNFKVANNFPNPITITVSRIVIKNKSDNTILIDDSPNWVLTPAAAREKNYDLAGKTVNGLITIEVTMSTPGSGSDNVTLNENTNLLFTAQVQNFSFNEVTAKIAQNDFNINDSVEIDDSTYYQSATIENGSLNITANSNIDLALNATLSIPALKDGNGNPFTQVISLGRKEKNKIIQISSLKNYTLTAPNGTPVNRISYSLNVSAPAANDFRTILKTDDVSASLSISNLYFRSFIGRVKPTRLKVDETTIDLSIGDFSDKLTVNQIDMENPKINIRLRKSTNVEIRFSGQMIGRSSSRTSVLNIPQTTMSTGETIISLNTSDVRNFIKSFSGKLPTTITVKGEGVVNPSYTLASIASADSVYGTAEIEFPMKVSVTGGSIRDSSAVDLTDKDREEMRKVLGGTLVLDVSNGVAFDASFSARVYDASNRFLMNLPPNRAPNDTLIHIQGAAVSTQGKVTAPSNSKITFSLNQDDVDKITRGKYIISKVSFFTSGNNGLPVEFKTSDAIQIKMYGGLKYKVEEKK